MPVWKVNVEDLDVKKIVTTIRKMSINEGDVIHIKLTSGVTYDQASQLGNDLSHLANERNAFFIIGDIAETINKLSDKQMKKHGWKRI